MHTGAYFLTTDLHCSNKEAKFSTIGDILRKDGVIIDKESIVYRALTGSMVGSAEDHIARVVISNNDFGTGHEIRSVIVLRAGITVPGTGATISQDRMLCEHLEDNGIVCLADGSVRDSDGICHDAINWPAGSTPFDTPEMQNWIVSVDGQPYTPPWILGLTDISDTDGLQIVEQQPMRTLSSSAVPQHAL